MELDGGIHHRSCVTVVHPDAGLSNVDSVDVQFLLNVVKNGKFHVFFTVKALPLPLG